MLIQATKLMTNAADAAIEPGWVRLEDGAVVEWGHGEAPGPADRTHDEGLVAPGFVDIHCHGGNGGDFASGDADQIRRAQAFHAEHGTGAMLASLVTAPADALCTQLAAIADVVEAGDTAVVGSHLEGPYLSHSRCGAQNPAYLALPDVAAFEAMLEASRGTLRMITVAPELLGADALITAVRNAGVTVAIGHTDAGFDDAKAAGDAGAQVATHLFNGMRPLHHRDPGPVLAALDGDVFPELINDGVHLHPAIVRHVVATKGRRSVLVTDAMSAAGLPDGQYALGGLAVTVDGGAARLTEGSSLAGSTLTMDVAVSNAVSAGIAVEDAVHAATAAPAEAIGRPELGTLRAGTTSLVHVADDGTATRIS